MSTAHVTFWQAGGFSLLYTRGQWGGGLSAHRLKGRGQAAPDRPFADCTGPPLKAAAVSAAAP